MHCNGESVSIECTFDDSRAALSIRNLIVMVALHFPTARMEDVIIKVARCKLYILNCGTGEAFRIKSSTGCSSTFKDPMDVVNASFTFKDLMDAVNASGWRSVGGFDYLMHERNYMLFGCDFGGDERIITDSTHTEISTSYDRYYYTYLDITNMSGADVDAHRRAHRPMH